MKAREIIQSVLDGKINLDFQGHMINGGWSYKKNLAESYQRSLEGERGDMDGKWNMQNEKRTIDEVNADMRRFYRSSLDYEYQDGDVLENKEFLDMKCCHCAERLFWRLRGSSLILDRRFNYEYTSFDECIQPIEGGCKIGALEFLGGSIEVNSPLIFANFFGHDDTPDESKYTDDYGLNYLIGRKNITSFKAETQNVAYGQMGNMSIGVYLSKDKKSIKIASPWMDDSEEYESELVKDFLKNHDFCGSISLCLWRWEATDLNTLGTERLKSMKAEKYPQDIVELDVPFGTWEFKHYYDIEREPFIYSEFTLQ